MMESKWLWLSVLMLLLEGCRWCSTDACSEDERIALLQLKPFFNPDNQLNSWVEDVKGSDCCQWEGVECNTSSSSRRIIGLSLNYTGGPNHQSWSSELKVKDWYLNASLFLSFKELKRLYLPGNAIAGWVEIEGFAKLSFALDNLEILDLSNNYFNDTILLFLSELSSLKDLNLAGNLLTGSSDAKGFQWLSRLSNLESLDLGRNKLKNNILFHMGGLLSLRALSLSGNNLEGTVHIDELNNLRNLKYLDLSFNGIESLRPSNQGNETQLKLINLEVLDLGGNLFRNNTFAFLRGLSSLTSLYMGENHLQGSIDITDLNNLINLKKLDLNSNNIEGLQSFQDNGRQLNLINLEELDLRSNLLNGSIFASFRMFPNLKSLIISYNQLKGSIDMKGALINLKKLDLSSNNIESLQILPSGRQLNLTHLEELDLSRNLINDSIFASLMAFPNLKSLILSYNQLKGSANIKDLGAFTNLEELDMSSNDLNEFVAYKEFKSLKKLKDLYLNEVFTNGSIPLLKLVEAFPSVKTFFLELNCLNKTMATPTQELHLLSNVEEIFLDDSYLNNNILQSIGVLTSLKTLSLSNCGLTGSLPDQGWCDLRNLEVLSIDRNALEGMLPYCLGNLTSLLLLDISSNQFTGNLAPLANLTSVRFISLSRNRFQISMSFLSLANLPNLKILLGDKNKMVMEPNSFHTSLPKFQLNVIKLSKCTTDHELGIEPPNFLYYQYDLRYVDLSYSNFSGTVPLWLLEKNPKLEVLFLMGNSFTGPLSLPSVFNLNVSSIDISDNKLQGQIPTNICSTFPNLERLFLSKNVFEGNIPPCLSGMSDLSILDLSDNQLSGRVPEELIMRNSLEVLRLSNNNLSGIIVPMIFSSNRLSKLYLDGNNFVGEMSDTDIPTIDFSYSLQDIDLSNNSLHGKLPRWIGNVSSLDRLALSNNQFEGSIPVELCNLYVLQFLELSQNKLSGSIPSCFNPPYIRHVHLNGNRLSGPLTVPLNNPSLVTLDLTGNNLTGNIPEWIDTLSALSVLLLKANHLDGGIPVQLCKLYSLSIIDLSQNMFSGGIPSCLGNLTLATKEYKSLIKVSSYFASTKEDVSTYIGMRTLKNGVSRHFPSTYMEEWIDFTTKGVSYPYGGNILEYMSGIDLSNNKLSGHIPDELGNLSGILSLNLSHNNLIGVLPSSFSKLKMLESLDLSYNNLSGRIPIQLVELNFLEVFSVAHNNLSGSIPEPKAQFGTFDESSYEGNPHLCGLLLHKNCFKTESPSTIPTTSDDEGEGSFMDTHVFCVSFLVSYVAVLLGIFAVLYINPYWRKTWFSFIEGCITTCRYSTVGNFLELHIFRRCA